MTSEAAASEEARGPLLLAPAGRREALLLALALALVHLPELTSVTTPAGVTVHVSGVSDPKVIAPVEGDVAVS